MNQWVPYFENTIFRKPEGIGVVYTCCLDNYSWTYRRGKKLSKRSYGKDEIRIPSQFALTLCPNEFLHGHGRVCVW